MHCANTFKFGTTSMIMHLPVSMHFNAYFQHLLPEEQLNCMLLNTAHLLY